MLRRIKRFKRYKTLRSSKRQIPFMREMKEGTLRRMLLLFLAGCLLFFMLPPLYSTVHASFSLTSDSLKRWTRNLSTESLLSVLTVEIPQIKPLHQSSGVKMPQISSILVEMATSLNPEDPRTLIRTEIPGFILFDDDLIVAGRGVTYATLTAESSPPLEVVLMEREAVAATLEQTETEGLNDRDPEEQEPSLSTEGRQVAFIYHTHNRESWLPHIPSAQKPEEAFHDEINITLVGLKLGEELEKRGIGTQVDTTDISQKLNQKGLSYRHSYDQSRQVVEAAVDQNKDIQYIFDLHRDAVAREHTTFELNGKEYARPFFVIGKRNPDYQKNVRFAEEINRLLEERYPGLSRGIVARNTGHGEYNQSISEHTVLIEIGGVENTLEESYRTVEVLADVIADIYWQAEKVDATADTPKFSN